MPSLDASTQTPMTDSGKQPAEIPAAPATEDVPSPEEVKEAFKVDAPAVEDIAATTVTEPLADDVNKQPTVTHAEAGTAHTDAEPATKADGTQADKLVEETAKPSEETTKPTETKEKKEDKKNAIKEKVEKTKSEGKGFFSRFFGNKDKPAKKEKKTPKTEKADPIATEATPAQAIAVAPVEAAPEAPVVTEAPVETAPVEAPKVAEVEPTVEAPVAETAPAAEATKVEEKKEEKEEHKEASKPNLKAHRRLSARIGDIFKPKKKEGVSSPKDEAPREDLPAPVAEETSGVATEAPKLEKPIATEPLKLEDPKTASAQPIAAPTVTSSA
nr:hypothetical protein L203_06114 [Cryptococcus depauperatus CBS 7841]